MSDNNNKNFKETIVIDTANDELCNVITINSSDQYLDKNYSYRISPDGKIVFTGLPSDWNESHLKGENAKEILTNELVKCGFEKIPVELTEIELKDILEFSVNKIFRNLDYGQIYPFSVEKVDDDNIKIILLLYNVNTFPLELRSLPIKLRDANKKVIFAEMIGLNKEIGPKKTGIYYLKVNIKELNIDSMDLTTWNITFEL